MPLVPSHLIQPMSNDADTALQTVFSSLAAARNEVDFIEAVVLSGVPGIAAAWRPILAGSGIALSIIGVFCHKTPLASFKTSSRCELADLLIVVDDVTGGAVQDRRAVLVQAKLATSAGQVSIGTGGPSVQLDLYEHWHLFTLSSGYDPRSRDFGACTLPGATLDDGRYGIIDQFGASPLWTQVEPTTSPMKAAGEPALGTFMAHMTEIGSRSYGREALAGGTDDWSFTVDELLTVTAGQSFVHRTRRHDRQVSAIALAIPAHPEPASQDRSMTFTQPPMLGGPRDFPDRAEDGISTIRVMLSREG